MKKVWVGIESSGKSLQLSINAERVLLRNRKWFAQTGKPRTMAFNQPMNPAFVKRITDSRLPYVQFKDFEDIIKLEQADIFIDELIKFFPASGSAFLSREQLDFITQAAKSGNHIYAASQDFSQVHKQFRLLVNHVYVVSKIIGSRRPMKTAPPVKHIWGICMMRSVKPSSFKGDTGSMKEAGLIPSFFFINKEDTDRFDTTFKIPLTKLPLKVVRKQEMIGYGEDGESVEYKKTVWI